MGKIQSELKVKERNGHVHSQILADVDSSSTGVRRCTSRISSSKRIIDRCRVATEDSSLLSLTLGSLVINEGDDQFENGRENVIENDNGEPNDAAVE